MTEITSNTTPKIAPTSIATSLGTPDPATTTMTSNVTDLVTTDLETISRNKRSALTPDIPKVIVAFVSPDAASVLAHTNSIRGSSKTPALITHGAKRDATDVVSSLPRKCAKNDRAAPENCTLDEARKRRFCGTITLKNINIIKALYA